MKSRIEHCQKRTRQLRRVHCSLTTYHVLVVLILLFLPCVSSKAFRPICEIKSEPVVLYRDPETGDFMVATDKDTSTRLLSENTPAPQSGTRLGRSEPTWSAGIPIRKYTRKARELAQNTTTSSIRARYCACRGFRNYPSKDPVYCPMHMNYCGYPRHTGWENEPLGCLYVANKREFCRNTMWVTMCWLGVLIMAMLCSRPGRHMICYVASFCVPAVNKWIANHLQRRQPERVRSMLRQNIRHRRVVMARRRQRHSHDMEAEDALLRDTEAVIRLSMPTDLGTEETPKERLPDSLKLRTRVFCSDQISAAGSSVAMKQQHSREEEHTSFDEGTDASSCVICFQVLKDGDRVGVIPCAHVFHAACLKTWCARRNVCPLCQSQEIAVPHYNETASEDVTNMNNETSENAEASLPQTQ